MSWVIEYIDCAYEYEQGSGFPCRDIAEAKHFDSYDQAAEHAENLVEVFDIFPV